MKQNLPFSAGFLDAELVATNPIGKMKYMDWKRAKQIIKEAAKEDPYIVAAIGLREDWQCTHGIVYKDDNFIFDEWIWAKSTWATPVLDIDDKEIECWTYEETTECTPVWWGKEQ